MPSWKIGIVVLVWSLAALATAFFWRRWQQSSEARRRLFADREAATVATGSVAEMSWLQRWLFLAGYRQPNAVAWFVGGTTLCLFLGVSAAFAIIFSGVYELMEIATAAVPGGVGEVFLPAVYLTPWTLVVGVGALPTLLVRRRRQLRVESVDQDLPLALELMATLSEAGLGFDAALARIQETRLAARPLATEFRSFQADLLAGRPRSHSLRRFSERLRIPAVSIFVSAMVQADQLGMGIASVLRRQADDLRDRRRERANAFAMSLPVKRVVPMVVCFLPGLFVWTLGPFFVQLFQLAEQFTRGR